MIKRTEDDQNLTLEEITSIVREELVGVGFPATETEKRCIYGPRGIIRRESFREAFKKIRERCYLELDVKAESHLSTVKSIVRYVKRRIEEDVRLADEARSSYEDYNLI